jgi:ATP-dependent Zn protease
VKQRLRLPLTGFAISLVTVLTIALPATATATMEYREFIAQVEADKINQVALLSDRSRAIFTREGQSVEVVLPADQGLIDTLAKNNVDITVRSPEVNPWFRLIQSVLVPTLLVGGPLALLCVALIINFAGRRAR